MSANDRKSAVIAQMAALTGFIHGDGREAFNTLSNGSRAELMALFATLADDLKRLNETDAQA